MITLLQSHVINVVTVAWMFGNDPNTIVHISWSILISITWVQNLCYHTSALSGPTTYGMNWSAHHQMDQRKYLVPGVTQPANWFRISNWIHLTAPATIDVFAHLQSWDFFYGVHIGKPGNCGGKVCSHHVSASLIFLFEAVTHRKPYTDIQSGAEKYTSQVAKIMIFWWQGCGEALLVIASLSQPINLGSAASFGICLLVANMSEQGWQS